MNKDKSVLVCVTPQASSEILVKSGEVISKKLGARLEVVSVLPLGNEERPIDPQIIEKLYQTANESGGDMGIYFSDNPILTLCVHIGKVKPECVVVGFPGEGSNRFVSFLHLLLPDIPISMVGKDSTVYNLIPGESALPAKAKK